MITMGWKVAGALGGAVALFTAGVGAGWTLRDGLAAKAQANEQSATITKLIDARNEAVARAEQLQEREAQALQRVELLERSAGDLQSEWRLQAHDVQISDACAQCRLGADAVGLLQSAATGSEHTPSDGE
jgi:hypothetical protein